MTISTTITDRPTGVTLTAYRDDSIPAVSYKITTTTGGELDLTGSEWVGVTELAERWKDGES